MLSIACRNRVDATTSARRAAARRMRRRSRPPTAADLLEVAPRRESASIQNAAKNGLDDSHFHNVQAFSRKPPRITLPITWRLSGDGSPLVRNAARATAGGAVRSGSGFDTESVYTTPGTRAARRAAAEPCARTAAGGRTSVSGPDRLHPHGGKIRSRTRSAGVLSLWAREPERGAAQARLVARVPLARAHRPHAGGRGRQSQHRGGGRPDHSGRRPGARGRRG